jgi:ABC-type transport system involved in multi-copper enzyme maturation permease subunit
VSRSTPPHPPPSPRRATPRQRIGAIARFAWLEAWRTRLLLVVAAIVAVATLASLFVEALAVTEATRVQVGLLAAVLRLAAVAIVALHVAGSWLREAQDKGLELLLSLDLARAELLAGKALGQAGVAVAIAAVCAVPIGALAPADAALAWAAGLALEAMLVAWATLFAVVTLKQLAPAVLFVGGFYVLARVMPAALLIAHASPLAGPSRAHAWLAQMLSAIALMLPPLERFASADALANGIATWSALPGLVGATLVSGAVLLGAAAFDLYRRNF